MWSVGTFFMLFPLSFSFFAFGVLAWTKQPELWPSRPGETLQTAALISGGTVLLTVASAALGASMADADKAAAVAVFMGAPIALAPLAAAVRLVVVKGKR